MPKAAVVTPVPMDTSIQAWLYNIHHVLHFPITILAVIGLITIGTFIETAPRSLIEFLNTYIGKSLLFIGPLVIALSLDWATGLLACAVALIIFAKLQLLVSEEGFTNDMATELVSTPNRWFVEKVLDETPIAISSDRVRRAYTIDNDSRTSSSSSMSSLDTSDGSSHK